MKQLQKVILINSGHVDFYELNLNGNIHFIGTQGTGKSTMLRAILFFYTAEARKLGISKEKKPFSEYYFPHSDSSIVYEVLSGERQFCVWLYKRQNRLCFRFIDGAYSREMFIEQQCARSEKEVMGWLSAHNIKFTPYIYNFTKYRDIIYGATTDNSRYHLMKNRNYQNIPRTLSNIFLNSSLDGGFIKQTIINSLSDDMYEIDMDTNRHHLLTASHNYNDVMEYIRQEKKAHNIIERYNKLLEQEELIKEMSINVGGAYNKAKEEQRRLVDQGDDLRNRIGEQQHIMDVASTHFKSEVSNLREKLTASRLYHAKGKEKQAYYAQKNIEAIIEEQENKPIYEAQLLEQTQRLDLLKTGFQELEKRYEENRLAVESRYTRQLLNYTTDHNDRRMLIMQSKDDITKEYHNERDAQRVLYDEQRKIQDERKLQKIQARMDYENEVKDLMRIPLFVDEQQALIKSRQELQLKRQQFSLQKEQGKTALSNLNIQYEQERNILELQADKKLGAIQEEIAQTGQLIESVQAEIGRLAGSFMEYLEQHHNGWRDNIGKVIDRDLLLMDNLQPCIGEGDSLYGIRINCDVLEDQQLSRTDLEKQLENNTERYQQLQLKRQDILDGLQNNKDKRQKKYRKTALTIREEIKRDVLGEEQSAIGIERIKLSLEELVERQNKQRTDSVALLEGKIHQLNQEIQAIEVLQGELAKNYDTIEQNIEKQYCQKIDNVGRDLVELEDDIKEKRVLLDSSKQEQYIQLEKDRNRQLDKQGVDTALITKLEAGLRELEHLLEKISHQHDLVVGYRNDCKEYIDKIDDYAQQIVQHEQKIALVEKVYYSTDKEERNKLAVLKKEAVDNEQNIKMVRYQISSYDRFTASVLFSKWKSFIENSNRYTSWQCDEMISNLVSLVEQYREMEQTFNEKITQFLGYFNEGNILGFDVMASNHNQYFTFANNLREFVMEQKIIDYKTEVTRKYSMVYDKIAKDTEVLLEREGEVDKIIKRINSDFNNSNFVGVVRSIQLRLQPSTNMVVNTLRKIRQYQAENMMQIGELNLFNQGAGGKKDNEAVKLLDELKKYIDQSKHKVLRLEDAFDLEFRIKENENDTHWVNRLANVGSNGTDVLVKSMIYINLLYIFKGGAKSRDTDTQLHCLIDEVGILHDSNVTGLITFAGERNIRLINGSPNSHNEQDYRHIYMFRKKTGSNKTGITKLISNEI